MSDAYYVSLHWGNGDPPNQGKVSLSLPPLLENRDEQELKKERARIKLLPAGTLASVMRKADLSSPLPSFLEPY